MPHAAGLHYEIHGPSDGVPVILSAGLGGSGSYWGPNLEALAGDHRVILYDHRGTARSDRTVDAPYPITAWARDAVSVLDDLGIASAAFVGHAAGGLAGLALAAWQPERVDRLVVVNGWLTPDPHFLRCFAVRLALLRNSGVEAYLRAQPIFLYPANWASAHNDWLEAELAHQLVAFPGPEIVEQRVAAVCAFDGETVADGISVRTLVIGAKDDMLVPSRCSELLAAKLSNAELCLMEWGGHACNVTDPGGFNERLLDFLRS